jgi:hypothetical protein
MGDEKVPVRLPWARPHSPSCKNTGIAAVRYNRVAAVRSKEPLEVMDSLAETSSRAAHQAEARTPVNIPMEVPITTTGDCRLQVHIEGGTPAKRP